MQTPTEDSLARLCDKQMAKIKELKGQRDELLEVAKEAHEALDFLSSRYALSRECSQALINLAAAIERAEGR